MREQLISYILSVLATVTDYSKRQVLQGFLNYLQTNVNVSSQEIETIRNVVNTLIAETAQRPQPQGFVFKNIDNVVYNTRNIPVPGFWDKTGILTRADVTTRSTLDHRNDYFVNIFKGAASFDPEFSVVFASKYNYAGGTDEITKKHYLSFVNQYRTNIFSTDFKVPVDPDNPGAGERSLENFVLISLHNFADSIDVGNFLVNLAFASGSVSATISLVDNSLEGEVGTPIRTQVQPFYYLVSGSLVNGAAQIVTHSIPNKIFGVVFPQSMLIALDLDALGDFVSASFNLSVGGYDALNQIYPLVFPNTSTPTLTDIAEHHFSAFYTIFDEFRLSTVDNVHSLLVFCRVKAEEFNYSLNPTFYDPTSGRILYPEQGTYITTIGIYDQNNQLVALGRLSSPLRKTSEDEYVIKLKLEF